MELGSLARGGGGGCVSRVCVRCALISQSNKHHDKNTDGDESGRLLCFNLAASTALTLPCRHPRPPSGPSTPGSRSIPCQVLRSEGDVRCGASPSCCGIACADHEVATCGLRPLLLDRRGTLETHRHLVCVPVVTRGQRAEVLIRDVTEDAVPEATERGFCRSRCRKM